MQDNNLFILTIYIIGVTYTFNLMVESIAEQVKFIFDKSVVDEQLKEQNLQDDIGISFRFSPFYEFDALKELSMSVENKSKARVVYVDWDNCSLIVDHSKQSRRVIRKSPDLSRDLAVPQSPTLIAPANTLTQSLTAEDVFEREPEKGIYVPKKPIFDLNALKNHPLRVKRRLYARFVSRREELKFSLQLVLRTSELRVGLVPGENKPPMYIIDCPFIMKKLPWTYALPWNKRRVV